VLTHKSGATGHGLVDDGATDVPGCSHLDVRRRGNSNRGLTCGCTDKAATTVLESRTDSSRGFAGDPRDVRRTQGCFSCQGGRHAKGRIEKNAFDNGDLLWAHACCRFVAARRIAPAEGRHGGGFRFLNGVRLGQGHLGSCRIVQSVCGDGRRQGSGRTSRALSLSGSSLRRRTDADVDRR